MVVLGMRRKRYRRARPSMSTTINTVSSYELLPLNLRKQSIAAATFDQSIAESGYRGRQSTSTSLHGGLSSPKNRRFNYTFEKHEDLFDEEEETNETVEELLHIGSYLRDKDVEKEVEESWRFVALVMDRILLICFTIASVVGSMVIFLQAPYFYDYEEPIDDHRPFYTVRKPTF